jgi:hypothetical protein
MVQLSLKEMKKNIYIYIYKRKKKKEEGVRDYNKNSSINIYHNAK